MLWPPTSMSGLPKLLQKTIVNNDSKIDLVRILKRQYFGPLLQKEDNIILLKILVTELVQGELPFPDYYARVIIVELVLTQNNPVN